MVMALGFVSVVVVIWACMCARIMRWNIRGI